MEKTTTISHVLDCSSGAIRDFKRAVLPDLSPSKICLEQGAHLCVTWSTVLENGEVEDEGKHVNSDGNENQANNSSYDMGSKINLEFR